MTELDPTTLDPGIRDVVALLRGWQYQTTDSGDGVSKAGDPDALPFPHVHIRVEPPALYPLCELLAAQLAREGVHVVPEGESDDDIGLGECTLEGVYLVGAGVALITVAHLDDDDLAHARTRK